MPASPYAAAPKEKLDEIIRLAEARLSAQLTLGVAADQRAMTFASILSALDAAVVAALATLPFHPSLWALAIGLGVAAVFALWSAQPVAWDIPGYPPDAWLDDIVEGDELHNGLAAMAEHYAEAILDNDRILAANGQAQRLALLAIFMTLVGTAGVKAIWG